MLTTEMKTFLADSQHTTPYLLIDSSVITQQYNCFCSALPSVRCHFSVKSNPSVNVLKHMNRLGSFFEVASWGEVELCLSAGIPASQLHFGNTVKTAIDIRKAITAGVKTFAFDCVEELDKLLSIDSSIDLVCRMVTDGEGAVWRLHDKFGCSLNTAITLCLSAQERGGRVIGLSFHVGSQQRNVDAWCKALTDVDYVMSELTHSNINISLVNIGGGFPTSGYIDHDEHVDDVDFHAFVAPLREKVTQLQHKFGDAVHFIAEPGRFITAESGCIKSTVLLSTERFFHDHNVRWTYLDVGKFNGLYEASDVKLQAHLMREGSHVMAETMLAGPSCDSEDILSLADNLHHLPSDITEGDTIVFSDVGAYSMSYTCVAFNGIKPVTEYFI